MVRHIYFQITCFTGLRVRYLGHLDMISIDQCLSEVHIRIWLISPLFVSLALHPLILLLNLYLVFLRVLTCHFKLRFPFKTQIF